MNPSSTWTANPQVWPLGSSNMPQQYHVPRTSQTYPTMDNRLPASPQTPTRSRGQFQRQSPERSPTFRQAEYDYRRRSSVSSTQPTLSSYNQSSTMDPRAPPPGFGTAPAHVNLSMSPGHPWTQPSQPQYFDLVRPGPQDSTQKSLPAPFATEDHSPSGSWDQPSGSSSWDQPSPPAFDTRYKPEESSSKRNSQPSRQRSGGSGGKSNPYNSHRKSGRGNQDESFYMLEYNGSTSEETQRAPELDISLEADHQDFIFQQLNEILSTGMFNFFARHQFPIPTDPCKRMVRKPADREWHEWLELAIALCEKRMIPKGFLHNERIKEFITTLTNSGEIRHAWAHPSRPLKSDLGILQLISAGVHVSQIIMDWEGMDKILKIYSETDGTITRNKRRRDSIKKTVRFLTPENLD